MKKQHIVVLLALLCLLTLAFSMTQAQTGRAFSTRTAYRNETGTLRFVGSNPGSPIVVPAAAAPGLTADTRAAAILDVYAPQFGVTNPRQDLQMTQAYTVNNTRAVNRYQQLYQGVPVIGGQLVVSTTTNGGLLSIVGEASPNLAINITPRVDATAAQQTAVAWAARNFGFNVAELAGSAPVLSIYDSTLMGPLKHPIQLVWNIEVNSTTLSPLRAMVLVNAHMGGIALGFNQIDDKHQVAKRLAANNTGAAPLPLPLTSEASTVALASGVETRAPGIANMETYDVNGGNTLPGTLKCDETAVSCTNGAVPEADQAHTFGRDSYDYFWEEFGRDSLDGSGLLLKSTVRFSANGGGEQYCNAFWNGIQMVYGKDCNIVADDVVGHELVHGLTNNTSQLFYYYQSGAINESLSDVFGEFIDLTNGAGNDSASVRWAVGEDTPFTAPDSTPGLRFMNNPPKDGISPDRIQSPLYWQEEYFNGGNPPSTDWDNGGVHINSGVNNKAAYLMVDGGSFNGVNVTGLGIEKAAAIYYDAQTTKIVSGTDYNDLYEILFQSCLDLVGGAEGITVANCDQVTNATQAVQMHLLPLNGWSEPEAEICPAGLNPAVVFGDDFEAGDSQFTTGALLGQDAWLTMEEFEEFFGRIYTHSGVRGWLGNNLGTPNTPNDSYLATANTISIPTGAFLRFDHAFLLEYDFVESYDGGIVEYSTNGTTWTQLNSIDSGQPYVSELATGGGNPLEGKMAFTNDSHGFVSTRFNLSALAGQNVKFRFRLGEDINFAYYGWFIDDVYVYTCSDVVPTATSTTNPNVTPTPTSTVDPNVTPTPTSTIDPNVTPTATSQVTATATSQPGSGIELVDNGSFETLDVNGKPVVAPWQLKAPTGDKALCNKPDKVFANIGDCAFRFKGNAGEQSVLQQNLDLSGLSFAVDEQIDVLWAMNVPTGSIGKIKFAIKYSDGTPSTKLSGAPVRTNGYEWWGSSDLDPLLIASANVSKIKFGISFRATTGKIYFDDISVIYTPNGAGLLPLPGMDTQAANGKAEAVRK